MKAIRIIAVLAFAIIASVIPFCLYMEHLVGIKMEKLLQEGIKIRHEGFEYFILLFFAAYSLPFLIWLGFIWKKTEPENMKKKLIYLLVILIFAVLPALLCDRLFYNIAY